MGQDMGHLKVDMNLKKEKNLDACMSGVGLNKMQVGFIYFLLA